MYCTVAFLCAIPVLQETFGGLGSAFNCFISCVSQTLSVTIVCEPTNKGFNIQPEVLSHGKILKAQKGWD